MKSNTPNEKINIIVADKSKVYLDALQSLIKYQKDIVLKGMFGTMNDLIPVLKNLDTGVLIIDMVMFESNTTQNVVEIKQQNPTLKIIVLSLDKSELMRKKFIDAGAHEYLYKFNESDELFEAIRCC